LNLYRFRKQKKESNTLSEKGVKYPICIRSVGNLELKKKKANQGTDEDTEKTEDITIDNIFDDDDEGIQTNDKLELDDGFEEFKPI